MATLLRRHGNVVTPAWQCYYAGVATGDVPCKRGYSYEKIGKKGDKNDIA